VFPNTAYQGAVLTDHPIGYWPLDEVVTNVFHDISGNGHDTTTNGTGCHIGVTGLIPTSSDLAARFDGGSSVMFSSTNISYSGNAMSAEAWINTLDGAARNVIVEANNGGGAPSFAWFFDIRSGVLTADIYDNTIADHVASGAGTVNDGQTHHVVFTFDGTTITLYKDGSVTGVPLVGAFQKANGIYDTGLGNAINFVTGTRLNGTLDDVALYDYALSADQVLAHYRAGTTL
jgi:hypothetical protein